MFEKVNMYHPDKVADRIAGALVDYAYSQQENPRIAVEVLIGHGECNIIAETSVSIPSDFLVATVERIAEYKGIKINYKEVPQDVYLANNQSGEIKCGDNGVFKGMPVTEEQWNLMDVASVLNDKFNSDGKYILDGSKLIICQSKDFNNEIFSMYPSAIVNPLGNWTGGIDVDSGATNRKLGSDMGDSVTGGGLCGKDLSKADVSVNIYAWLLAQFYNEPVEFSCAIGDTKINGKPYSEIVEIARDYINNLGGFEKFAEWGLIR